MPPKQIHTEEIKGELERRCREFKSQSLFGAECLPAGSFLSGAGCDPAGKRSDTSRRRLETFDRLRSDRATPSQPRGPVSAQIILLRADKGLRFSASCPHSTEWLQAVKLVPKGGSLMNGLSFQFGKMTLLVLFLSKYEENGLPSLIREAFGNLNLILSVMS